MNPRRGFVNVLTLVFMLISLSAQHVNADKAEELRAWAGIELFPSLLAADQDIASKQGDDGRLLLVLVYKDARETASEMSEYLAKREAIRKIPIKIEVISLDSLGRSYQNKMIAGIFLTQQLQKDEVNEIIMFGRERRVITFSPFSGDVERGVLGGIHVSDRVLPYLNKEALRQSRIDIKPFFLKIAEIYE